MNSWHCFGEGNWFPMQGDTLYWYPPNCVEVRLMMQLQNKIEEWDAIDLLSCSMWKMIFTLQTNSYSTFWNNLIPWGGGRQKSSLCFWILLSLLPWSTISRLHERQSGISLVCFQLSHLDLGTSEMLRLHVIWVWAGCISGVKWFFKAACLSVQNL